MKFRNRKLKTYLRLGIFNILRVIYHKIKIKSYFPILSKEKSFTLGEVFFRDIENNFDKLDYKNSTYYNLFASKRKVLLEKPNWHYNYLTKSAIGYQTTNWYQIPPAINMLGDIKGVWELSRFNWLIELSVEGDARKINNLLADWCTKNPPFKGVNWLCGQEASLRVLNLAFAARFLAQADSPEKALESLCEVHLNRIESTLSYAIAQDNNHAISEAAALYVGGIWLSHKQSRNMEAIRWAKKGRKVLEERVRRLILDDGSFSMYSTNYHRCILDILSFVEIWRIDFDDECFSDIFYQKSQAATHWLYELVSEKSGGVPLLGTNDGTMLFATSQDNFSDYRPSVQLSSVIFFKKCAWSSVEADSKLKLFNIARPKGIIAEQGSAHFPKGGYFLLRSPSENVLALMSYPRYDFRPSQADPLHVDLWVDGVNLLCDGGSFSYNVDAQTSDYFCGIQSHNTVQFDNYQPMPRISRFLFGDWLQASDIRYDASKRAASASYVDRYGAKHSRKITLHEKKFVIEDTIEGFKDKAILRWRLVSKPWIVTENGVEYENHRICVDCCASNHQDLRLSKGAVSRHYYCEETIPVLEVEIHTPTTITTEYHF